MSFEKSKNTVLSIISIMMWYVAAMCVAFEDMLVDFNFILIKNTI